MKRPVYQIENDINNIIFNQDNKNRALSIQLLPALFTELKQYHPIITQEHLFTIINSDERAQSTDKAKLSNRVTRVLSRLGIKKNKFHDYKRQWDLIKRSVDVPQYKRKWNKETCEIYPGITETEHTQDLEFTYTGMKRFEVGTLIRPLHKITYRELLI